MMHLRVTNLVKFKLNESQKIKFRSMRLNRKVDAVKFARWASPQSNGKLILNIRNNKDTELPFLSPKLTLIRRKFKT